MRRLIGCLIVILLVAAAPIYSQNSLSGTVLDNDSKPVAGAVITLTNMADSSYTFTGETDETGSFEIIVIPTSVDDNLNHPHGFLLHQNYPNPFNPATVISYDLDHGGDMQLEIYNVLGRKIATLIDGYRSGQGQVVWNATDARGRGVASGVYFYVMRVNDKVQIRKMLLLDGHRYRGAAGKMDASKPGPLAKGSSEDRYHLRITGPGIAAYEASNLELNDTLNLNIQVQRIFAGNDGKIYRMVTIGSQVWMAENLRESQYRDGTSIALLPGDVSWGTLQGAWCQYENREEYGDAYGYLYNWFAATNEQNLAPTGWHLPSDEEWAQLNDYLTSEQGSRLAGNAEQWLDGALDSSAVFGESGFDALPGGYRLTNGGFEAREFLTGFWSAAACYVPESAWVRLIRYKATSFDKDSFNRCYGFAVRLIRDYSAGASLTAIELDPPTESLSKSEIRQFNCTGLYSDGNCSDLSRVVTWSVNPDTLGSIDDSGLFTAHASNSGSCRVTATYEGYSAEAQVTIMAGTIKVGGMIGNDGKTYNTIVIGNQEWMAENLQETLYRDGSSIPEVTDNAIWAGLTTGARCVYDNTESNGNTYGYLYNWYAVDDSHNIAPPGWHVPTDGEWKELEITLGMSVSELDQTDVWRGTNEGSKLAGRAELWNDGVLENDGAFGSSGYNALPGGGRGDIGTFANIRNSAYFWSTTGYNSTQTLGRRHLDRISSCIYRSINNKWNGFSIRLIRD